jgi:hypothetical protein
VPHGITSQKTAFFIVTAVKTSNLTTSVSLCFSIQVGFRTSRPSLWNNQGTVGGRQKSTQEGIGQQTAACEGSVQTDISPYSRSRSQGEDARGVSISYRIEYFCDLKGKLTDNVLGIDCWLESVNCIFISPLFPFLFPLVLEELCFRKGISYTVMKGNNYVACLLHFCNA